MDTQNILTENRKLLSGFFVAVLIGHAFAQLVPHLEACLRVDDLAFANIALLLSFFCIAVRFFVGNQLHLLDKSVNKMPGSLWLYDLMAITIQCVMLILIASTCSVDISKRSDIGFLEAVIALYVVDIMWIVFQWILGKLRPSWKRECIPWGWAVLNTCLILCTIALEILVHDSYSNLGMAVLLTINIVAFVIDVVLIDFHDALRIKPESSHELSRSRLIADAPLAAESLFNESKDL